MKWIFKHFDKIMLAWFVFVVGVIVVTAYNLVTADWRAVAKDAGTVVGAFREGMETPQ